MKSGDVMVGFMLGVLLITVWSIYLLDRGRDECEQNLPRHEKCVQQWVPEKDAGRAAKEAGAA